MPIRVVLADDHTIMRHGLHSLMDTQPDIKVVGEAATGQEAVQVTQKGGYAPLESFDGKYLYYAVRSPADGIWRVPVGRGLEERVIPAIENWGNFAVTERGIYFVAPDSQSIQFYDFASEQTKTVAKSEKVLDFGLDATRDGRFVMYTQTDRNTNELLLVDHFR